MTTKPSLHDQNILHVIEPNKYQKATEQQPKQRPKNQPKSRFPEQSLFKLLPDTNHTAGTFNSFARPNHAYIKLNLW
jgi:hypothetical protein